jgi:ubiquinone/menaquinone biosynthesis C-methylase UbiE
MSPAWDTARIREFWREQAIAHGESPAASWSDVRMIELEIRAIGDRLEDGDSVLDVGCANGYSTVQFATRRAARVRGVDYVPEMIASARSRLAALPAPLRGKVEFAVGDAAQLDEEPASFDKVVSIRVVINLDSWDAQARALAEYVRVLRPGGTLLLSEATVQGWERLNALRREWGLDDIPMPPFNRYLDEDKVVETLAHDLELVECSSFGSTYYFGTRVLKPLLAAVSGAPVEVADPLSEWNRLMASLPAWGDYGPQKLFVFRKPG